MKTLLKSLLTFSLLFTHFLFAQTITNSTFLVKGDCGMCKERIETTAKKTGASIANWNAETQKLSVEFDAAKTSAEEILKKIAAVGHDNEMFSAPNDVYENLPGCCHYERETSILKTTPTETPQKAETE